MHVAKINHAYDLARRGPRITDQHVVVVGIAVNHAVAQARQDGHDLRFIERQKLLDKRAPLRVRDMFDKVPDPSGARRIPFHFAMGGGVRKRSQRRVHLELGAGRRCAADGGHGGLRLARRGRPAGAPQVQFEANWNREGAARSGSRSGLSYAGSIEINPAWTLDPLIKE